MQAHGALRLAVTGALAVGLLAIAPVAQGRTSANPVLQVNFAQSGSIAVTLDGAAVGAATGAPTVIPAGYYTLLENGPGGCAFIPYFELNGPGEAIIDNLQGGEQTTTTYNLDLQPNSTYTWRNDQNTTVLYTFTTNSTTVGTAPPVTGAGGLTAGTHGTRGSTDIVGSTHLTFRGNLSGAVAAAGSLALAYDGKSVTTLKAGRYTITVTDKSRNIGFVLKKSAKMSVTVTTKAFVGKHSMSVGLTAGKWILMPSIGATKPVLTIVVA